MFRVLALSVAAAAAFGAATTIMVVALAFGLYALVSPYWGAAGAAATVAVACAVLMLLLGVAVGSIVKQVLAKLAASPAKIARKYIVSLREKPITALAGVLSTGLMWSRKPRVLSTIIRRIPVRFKKRNLR